MTTAVKAYKGIGMEGSIATWYAKTTAKAMNDFRADARRVAAELTPPADVLEVAPGPGYFTVELARLGDYRVTALDISKTFLEIARKNAAAAKVEAEFVLGSAADLPFPADRFDFVFCRAAFKNFTEPVAALREMHRVLKPGGRALVVDLRGDASLESIRQAVDAMGLGPVNALVTRLTFRFMLLKRAYTKSGIEVLLRQTPCQTWRIEETGIGMDVWLQK